MAIPRALLSFVPASASFLWVCALFFAATHTASAEPARDQGIFSDLDPRVVLALPDPIGPGDAALFSDAARGRYLLYLRSVGGALHPVLAVDGPVATWPEEVRARLAPHLSALSVLAPGAPVPGGDRDGDGIPDPLDVLRGAKKVALNGAAYTEGYFRVSYPGGDVARDIGVCTDVIVRALRNAGVDLQRAVAEDVRAAPRAYPMVKRPDRNIDHRRVRTLLPWFKRHAALHGGDPAATDDPFRPGDVIFMDTFPDRQGPDHVGIVSDVRGPSGLYLVVNNWAPGSVESEMDLLAFVPVTHRFRLAPPRVAARPRAAR